MDHISKVTRRDILDLLRNGIEQESFLKNIRFGIHTMGVLMKLRFWKESLILTQ